MTTEPPLEEERLMAWEEEHAPDLPESAQQALYDLVADLLQRSYDQAVSDQQQIQHYAETRSSGRWGDPQ